MKCSQKIHLTVNNILYTDSATNNNKRTGARPQNKSYKKVNYVHRCTTIHKLQKQYLTLVYESRPKTIVVIINFKQKH